MPDARSHKYIIFNLFEKNKIEENKNINYISLSIIFIFSKMRFCIFIISRKI